MKWTSLISYLRMQYCECKIKKKRCLSTGISRKNMRLASAHEKWAIYVACARIYLICTNSTEYQQFYKTNFRQSSANIPNICECVLCFQCFLENEYLCQLHSRWCLRTSKTTHSFLCYVFILYYQRIPRG